MKTKSLLKKFQIKMHKFVAKKKCSVKAIHSLRVDCRKILSLLTKDTPLYTKLKKIIKLTNTIRDMDVFLDYYLASLPKEYGAKLELDTMHAHINKRRKKKLSKLYAHLKSFEMPKKMEVKHRERNTLPALSSEVPSLNQAQLHPYRIQIKRRLYTELNSQFIDEKKVNILKEIKDILGSINDNFNGLERIKAYSIDEKLFEQISAYTERENLKLFQEFKKLDSQYKEEQNVKRLYIIRHAKSSWKDDSLEDFERPLNKRGNADAPRMGKRLKARGVLPDSIISSPAQRAKTTAEFIAKELDCSEKIVLKKEMYESARNELDSLLKELEDTHKIVFLVGHNPELNMLAQMYVGFEENIVTCGIVTIEFTCDTWAEIHTDNARLIGFEYPKDDLN